MCVNSRGELRFAKVQARNRVAGANKAVKLNSVGSLTPIIIGDGTTLLSVVCLKAPKDQKVTFNIANKLPRKVLS